MPVSFAGWSVKAKVKSRRARVADAAHKELPAGGVRCPRPSAFEAEQQGEETGSCKARPLTAARERSLFDASLPYSAAIPML
jgi:hypothetical protein